MLGGLLGVEVGGRVWSEGVDGVAGGVELGGEEGVIGEGVAGEEEGEARLGVGVEGADRDGETSEDFRVN